MFDKKTDQEKESVAKLEDLVKQLDIQALDGNSSEKLQNLQSIRGTGLFCNERIWFNGA